MATEMDGMEGSFHGNVESGRDDTRRAPSLLPSPPPPSFSTSSHFHQFFTSFVKSPPHRYREKQSSNRRALDENSDGAECVGRDRMRSVRSVRSMTVTMWRVNSRRSNISMRRLIEPRPTWRGLIRQMRRDMTMSLILSARHIHILFGIRVADRRFSCSILTPRSLITTERCAADRSVPRLG